MIVSEKANCVKNMYFYNIIYYIILIQLYTKLQTQKSKQLYSVADFMKDLHKIW